MPSLKAQCSLPLPPQVSTGRHRALLLEADRLQGAAEFNSDPYERKLFSDLTTKIFSKGIELFIFFALNKAGNSYFTYFIYLDNE